MEVVHFPGPGRPALEALGEEELVAQEIVQRGAIHALQELIRRGVTRENADTMLRDLVANLQHIERESKRRKRTSEGRG